MLCKPAFRLCRRFITLQPGDIILTGTPPGVGCFRKPPLWLKAGDVVTCEIDGIGAITNTVVADPA
jgi:2-keto-4-pentenoate hydratase/2-oxohepta-3-ene-1,7-dioic acid hydratase in catechol pathway